MTTTLADLSADRLRVVVAESNYLGSQLIAAGLQRSRANFDVYAFCGDAAGVVREVQLRQPDVLLISAQLKDGRFTGFGVLEQLRAWQPKPVPVMLLDYFEREMVVDAFRCGARGIFCRGSSFKVLPKCIRCVHQGQIWASNSELDVLLEIITRFRPPRIVNSRAMALLTPRESDVARLVVEGMRNQEISTNLNLREHTVRNYLLRIFDKLGISSRVELILYATSLPELADHCVSDTPPNVRMSSAVSQTRPYKVT
jgi:DNA-binding NarL/FixJ family response regulator